MYLFKNVSYLHSKTIDLLEIYFLSKFVIFISKEFFKFLIILCDTIIQGILSFLTQSNKKL